MNINAFNRSLTETAAYFRKQARGHFAHALLERKHGETEWAATWHRHGMSCVRTARAMSKLVIR